MATVQQIAISSIIFLALFAGMTILFIDFQEEYGLTVEDRFLNQSSDQINKTYNLTQEIQTTFEGESSDQDNLDVSITGGFKALKKIKDMFKIVKNVLEIIATNIGLPLWIFNSVMAGILITITLTIIGAILGRRTE